MSKKSLITIVVLLAILTITYKILSINPAQDLSQNTNPQLQISPTQYPSMSQLKIEDLKVGTGPEVKSGDFITIDYLGTLENGKKFDSSYDRGQPFKTQIGVGQVIKGWDQGIVGLKVGGKRRLTIPSDLGYGSRGAGDVIPPNSTLIFEVELVSIDRN